MRARLGSFLPDLKAANDALPADTSSIQIEAPESASEYIEMDLGLGVLKEKSSNAGSSEDESVAAADEQDIMGQLLNRQNPSSAPRVGIVEVSDNAVEEEAVLPKELQLMLHPALEHYRLQAHIDHRLELELVLSLMTRGLKQLVRRSDKALPVDTMTQLNVLQEDLLKLMAMRDALLRKPPQVPVHETVYFDELEQLLAHSVSDC